MSLVNLHSSALAVAWRTQGGLRMAKIIAADRRTDGCVDECWDCGKTTEHECPRCQMPVCLDCAANGNHEANCA